MNQKMSHDAQASSQLSQASIASMRNAAEEDDGLNLLHLYGVIMEQLPMIAGVVGAFLLLATLYCVIATPIYQSNSLIQVENAKGDSLSALLGESSAALLSAATPVAGEIEIIRSRLVVGRAVSNLGLDVTVSPKYVPVIGRWLARGATQLSQPGFLGLAGYVSGNESIKAIKVDLPESLRGKITIVRLTQQGYDLLTEDGAILGHGQMGAVLEFKYEGQSGSVKLDSAVGLPGAEFELMQTSTLDAIDALQKQVTITEKARNSGVIQVSLQGAHPKLLANILNEIGAQYVRQNTERKSAEAEKSLAFLDSQLPALRKELEKSEASYNSFRTQQGIFDLTEESKVILDQTVELRIKLLELEQKKKELLSRFTALHPTVQAVQSQMADVTAELKKLEAKSKVFPAMEQDLLRLMREFKVNSELYTNLLNSFQQLRIVREGKVGNVRIVDEASVPVHSVKPARALIIAGALIAGILIGVVVALIRRSLMGGIKESYEIEQGLGLNVFANVPLSLVQNALFEKINRGDQGTHLLAQIASEDAAVESLRSLRTAMQFAMLNASNKIVVITGTTQGVGKSFLSANFAAVLAAGGKKVLLIDADIRRGYLHRYFGLKRGKGLSDFISGGQELSQVVHSEVVPGVDFISTGTLPPNPAELLMSDQMSGLIRDMEQRYDILLIDTSPILAVSDTLSFASLAGTVFLAVRSGISSLDEVQESVRLLEQSGSAVSGVIFNGIDISKRRYGYGGYRRYRYKAYGYKSYGYKSQGPVDI